MRESFLTNIVLILPLEPHLQIMVPVDEIHEPFQQVVALVLRQAVDVAREAAHGEDALPARDGVRPHDGVHGLQGGADVLGRAARRRVHLQAQVLRDFVEAAALEGGREALEELLVGRGDAVVDFVAGGPHGVWEGNWGV